MSQNQSIHAKSFVTETYDKFEDRKMTRVALPDSIDNVFFTNFKTWMQNDVRYASGFTFCLLPVRVKTPDVDSLVINYTYEGEDWGWVRDGNLIINIDGVTNITLDAVQADTSTGFSFYNGVQEIGYYKISPDDLSAICQANELEMKVTAQKFSFTLDNVAKQDSSGLTFPEKFLLMSRAFYAGINDDDTFIPQIEQIVQSATAANADFKTMRVLKIIGYVAIALIVFAAYVLIFGKK